MRRLTGLAAGVVLGLGAMPAFGAQLATPDLGSPVQLAAAAPVADTGKPEVPVPPEKRVPAIGKLAKDALDDVHAALRTYGGRDAYTDGYGSATKGILDSLIAEWDVHGKMDALLPDGDKDPRVSRIRTLLRTSRETNSRMVREARDEAVELARADNALRFRSQQIDLYQRLEAGLRSDEQVLDQIADTAR